MSKSNNTRSVVPLSQTELFECFKTFKSVDHDEGAKIFAKIFNNYVPSIDGVQWLSIGTGFGHLEKLVLSAHTDQPVCLECYEPGHLQFKHLMEWRDEINMINVEMHNRPFDCHTDMGDKMFDVITMSHVIYYYVDTEERRAIMSKLFDCLKPGGVVFITCLNNRGQFNDQDDFYDAFIKHLKFDADNGDNNKLPSVPIYGHDFAEDEMTHLLDASKYQGIIVLQELINYNIHVDLDLEELKKTTCLDVVSAQVLSFFMETRFRDLHVALQLEMIKWIKDHLLPINSGYYRMRQSACALVYAKV